VTRWFIDNNRVTWVLVAVLVYAGLSAYLSMPQSEDPGFTIRTAVVITLFPGASPERVEQLVTDKIEREVQQIPELDFVQSVSRTGVSEVFVNIKQSEQKMRPIWDDLRRKIDATRSELPGEVIGPVVNDDFGDVFGIVYALTGEGYTYRELKKAADQMRDAMLRLDDVARVDIHGAQEERVFVEFSNARLAELHLAPSQLGQLLQAQNIVIPGGEVTVGPERIVLEPSGSFQTVEELAQSVVTLPGSADVLYLGDIANVTRGYVDPPERMMRYNGQPALGLSLSLRDGGNVVRLGEATEAMVTRLEASNPIGLELHPVAFQPAEVTKSVNEFVNNLTQAIVLVMAVMLVFLGPRTGLVVASLIPTTIAITFLVMSVGGIGINTISLAALIIALGMLVDNAIVMSESIQVAIREGAEPPDAAVQSARELAGPLLTSSLTTAAAFLPFYLSENATGEYTGSLFLVVSIALIVSWLLSLTFIPMLAAMFIRVTPTSADEAFDTAGYRRYRGVLVRALSRPWTTVAATIALFGIAMYGMGLVPKQFFPSSDRPMVVAEIDLPPATSIGETTAAVHAVDGFLGTNPVEGLNHWTTFVGEGGPRFTLTYNPAQQKSSYAVSLMELETRDDAVALTAKLQAFIDANLPNVDARIAPLEIGPPVGKPIAVRISGPESGKLFEIADALKAQMATLRGTRLITDDWGQRSKKLNVDIDQTRARLSGVSSYDVATSLGANLSGIQTTQFREGADVIPVVLRSVAADRQDIGKLETLHVHAASTGRSVPLKQVADLRLNWEAGKILRRQRSRTVTVEADLEDGVSFADVNKDLVQWLEDNEAAWGIDYTWELGGESEASEEANAAIGSKFPIATLLIILLLVGQFNSIRRPAIVLFTLPLGMIGVVGAFLITGDAFGFMPTLGVVALFGIIINNAVVLLDRIEIEITGGLPANEAVVMAAQRRLRPILLTTATTIAGLFPLALFGGPLFEPMGRVIMGGLAFATLLTLVIVPVLYSLLFRVRHA